MSRKKRKSCLERAESTILEHIPEKYQKSVAGVYRLGLTVNRIGIVIAIIVSLVLFSSFYVSQPFSSDTIIALITILVAALGLALLGGGYSRMRLNPPLAFGWALFLGIISLVIVVYFAIIIFALAVTPLNNVYGSGMVVSIGILAVALVVAPLLVLINSIYYLFFAHKGYLEWYKDFAKRHHLGEEAKVVKKTKKATKTDDCCDEDI